MTLPESVIVETAPLTNESYVKIVTLNKPKALNALDLTMASALLKSLKEWQYDESVRVVILQGQGGKAFCAGGDVVSMHNAMAAQPNEIPESVETFFTVEYELDYLIHTYTKPIIVIGQGYVMGGGMGLYAGASHKLVTPSTKLAMPEITIGLYPDVGGSYFLPRLPKGIGLFLGLTGIPFGPSEALSIGFANAMVPDNCTEALVTSLQQKSDTSELDASAIDEVIAHLSIDAEQTHSFKQHQSLIDQLASVTTLQEAQTCLESYQTDDKWALKAVKNFKAGSPITAHLVWEQLKQGAMLNLLDCFQMELVMSCQCAAFGEFQEGVRALLIDKDGQPQWRFSSIDEVPERTVRSFFESPWTAQSHPLAQLQTRSA